VSPNFPPKLATHLAESVCAARCCYRKRLARCQKKFSEHAVHDLRTETRRILARMAADAFKAGEKVWITANNKAEGSAPLSLLKLAEEIAKILD